MKNITFLIFLFLISNAGISQKVPCSLDTYDRLKNTANRLAQQGQYKEAIAKYTSAKTCRPEKTAEIDREIARVFDLVNGERIKAERERDRAEQRRKEAVSNLLVNLCLLKRS